VIWDEIFLEVLERVYERDRQQQLKDEQEQSERDNDRTEDAVNERRDWNGEQRA
jgi:hypothetical protein